MTTKPVQNAGDEDRTIEALGIIVPAGTTVEVPAEVAGRPPKGKPDSDGYDPGEGLLAQPVNWLPGKASKVDKSEEKA